MPRLLKKQKIRKQNMFSAIFGAQALSRPISALFPGVGAPYFLVGPHGAPWALCAALRGCAKRSPQALMLGGTCGTPVSIRGHIAVIHPFHPGSSCCPVLCKGTRNKCN